MPTGYTAAVKDGITFPEFVWTCARAFGALVTMRDDPQDTPVPQEFEPSAFYAENLAKHEAELARLKALTPEQAHAEAINAHGAALKSWAVRKQERVELRRKYEAMLDVRASSPAQPLKTQTTENRHAVVSATLVPNTTGNAATSPTDPLKTVATGGHHMLAAANMIKLRGTGTAVPADEPLHTISAGGGRGGIHHAEVRAFLMKYYGTDQDPNLREPLHTCTTKDRFGLVTVKGEPYQIVDIGMRMLTPRELYRAQGFKDSYQIDFGTDPFTGERMKLTKTAQVRMCGNSVCPPVAAALVRANYTEQAVVRELEAA